MGFSTLCCLYLRVDCCSSRVRAEVEEELKPLEPQPEKPGPKEKTQKAVSLSIVGGQATDIGLKPAKVRHNASSEEGETRGV